MINPGHSSNREALSEAQEDYLKQIFLLGDEGRSASTRALAERLGVRPASVTGMVQRLAALALVEHEPYRGVRLTSKGRRVALEILRHHRLLETFLQEVMGYGWDEVHPEAERLEHVISEHFERRMAEALGHPTHDPHGDPIPRADLSMPEPTGARLLSDQGMAGLGRIARVGTQDPDALALLGRLGLVPGARVDVLEHTKEGVRMQLASGQRYLVPHELSCRVWVAEPEPAEEEECR